MSKELKEHMKMIVHQIETICKEIEIITITKQKFWR